MVLRCSECGFKSGFAAFFRRERGGLFGRNKTVCEACSPYNPTPFEQKTTLHMLMSPLSFLFAIPLVALHEPVHAGFICIMAVTALLSLPLRVFVHEAGHAYAARLCGHVVWTAHVGSGPIRRRLRLPGVNFDILRYPWVGGLVLHIDPKGSAGRVRNAFIAAAGPGANFLAAAVAFVGSRLVADAGVLSAILGGFGLFNLVMGVFNLIPRKTGDHAGTVSDGQHIVNAFGTRKTPVSAAVVDVYRVQAHQHQGQFEMAVAVASEAWENSPYRMFLANSIMHNLSRARGDRAVIDFYQEHREMMRPETEGASEHLPWIQANVAWSAIKLGDPDFMALAGETARAALQALPGRPEMQGTWGAWLVVTGRAEEGIPFLTRAARAIVDPHDKADFCRFLSDGWRQRGDFARAEAFDTLR